LLALALEEDMFERNSEGRRYQPRVHSYRTIEHLPWFVNDSAFRKGLMNSQEASLRGWSHDEWRWSPLAGSARTTSWHISNQFEWERDSWSLTLKLKNLNLRLNAVPHEIQIPPGLRQQSFEKERCKEKKGLPCSNNSDSLIFARPRRGQIRTSFRGSDVGLGFILIEQSSASYGPTLRTPPPTFGRSNVVREDMKALDKSHWC